MKIRAGSTTEDTDTGSGQKSLCSFEHKTVETTPRKKPQVDDPGSDESDDGDGESDTDGDDEPPVGVIYARVSGQSQTEGDADEDDDADEEAIDSGSIKGQVSQLESLADDLGIELPHTPFIDKAKTGRNFDREGIQDVFRTVKEEDIDYLLVEKVDRIGRNAPETLYFISVLQRDCDVTLLTLSGEQDISQVEGLMHTTLMSLMAEVQNDLRITKAKTERIRGFLEKLNWKAYSPRVPLGYTETDDGWLTVDPDEKPVIREIFRKFTECEEYKATERHIEDEFGSDVLDGYQIKTVLQQEAYIGRPQIPEDWIEGTSYDETVVEDPDLHLLRPEDDDGVGEETFHEAQAIIEQKNQRGDSEKPLYTIDDFIDEFGFFPTVVSSEPVTLLHHCGEPMIKTGQVELGGKFNMMTHRYKCTACEDEEDPKNYYRRWPKQFEAEAMEVIQKVLKDGWIFCSDSESDEDSGSDTADGEQSDDN